MLGACGGSGGGPGSEARAAAAGSRPAGTDGDSGAGAADAKEPVLVRVGLLAERTILRVLEATATVESLDIVDVYPERTQPVVELLVEEGDRVAAGAVLARLRDDEETLALSEAKVRLAEAENDAARARRDHERNLALFRDDSPTQLISERELEASQQAMVTADTAHEAARVALDRARYRLTLTEIRSPIAGTISLRAISLGDMANPSMTAFRIVDDSAPKVVFHRPQRELTMLHPGQELTATSEALPGVVLRGRVERISPVVDTGSGTVKVTAALERGEQPIPIGVLVRIELVLDRHEDALLVPKKAVLYEGADRYCFAVRDGKAHRLPIRPGFEEPGFVESLPNAEGEGLVSGDVVVLVGTDRLADGDPVELAEE